MITGNYIKTDSNCIKNIGKYDVIWSIVKFKF